MINIIGITTAKQIEVGRVYIVYCIYLLIHIDTVDFTAIAIGLMANDFLPAGIILMIDKGIPTIANMDLIALPIVYLS